MDYRACRCDSATFDYSFIFTKLDVLRVFKGGKGGGVKIPCQDVHSDFHQQNTSKNCEVVKSKSRKVEPL